MMHLKLTNPGRDRSRNAEEGRQDIQVFDRTVAELEQGLSDRRYFELLKPIISLQTR